MHFKTRYEELPNLFSIGIVEEETSTSAATFGRLTERNAFNLHVERASSAVIEKDTAADTLQTKIICKLEEVI